MANKYSLEFLLGKLMKLKDVREEIEDIYGKKTADRIIKDIQNNIPPDKIEEFDISIIDDLIFNNSTTVDSLTGMGGYGKFPIDINKYGSVYWIMAPEFEPIGYFKSKRAAVAEAEYQYCDFIEHYKEECENED